MRLFFFHFVALAAVFGCVSFIFTGCGENNTTEDIYSLEQLIRFEPGNTKARFKLGLAYSSKKNYDKAIAVWKESLTYDRTDTATLMMLSITAFRLERFEDALPALQILAEMQPTHPEAFQNLGNVYMKLNRFDEAVVAYKTALTLDRKMPESLFSLGAAYLEKGQRDSMQTVLNELQGVNTILANRLRERVEKADR